MKKILSSLLCAALLLTLLPVETAPARLITSATVTCSAEAAFVGQTLTWSVSNQIGSGPGNYVYWFHVYRNDALLLDDPSYDASHTFSYTPAQPGTYRCNAIIADFGATSSSTAFLSIFSGAVDVTPLPGPLSVWAEPVSGTALAVAWDSVTGADGYELWFSTQSVLGYRLAKTTTANTFTKTYLTPGTRYFFKVRAYVNVGGVERYSAFGPKCIGVPLAKPKITFITAVHTSITVRWDAIPGAHGCIVSVSDRADGAYIVYGKTAGTEYTITHLTPNTAYWVKVMAYCQFFGVNYFGPLSAYRSVKTLRETGR